MNRAEKTTPVSVGGKEEDGRLALKLERGTIMEYVPGGTPYVWIGTNDGRRIDSITVADLTAFLEEGGQS